MGDVSVRDLGSRMERVADSLTMSLLRELGRKRPIGAVKLAGLGGASLPALKSFLQGEQFYRRTLWDSALVHYERAVLLEPTFALALRRAGLSIAWLHDANDTLSLRYLLRAGASNHGLGPRDSLLVSADSLRSSLVAFDADAGFLPRARRLFSTLEKAAKRYPNDPEVWFALGDARYHYGFGPGLGVVDREMLGNFDLAISLDSAFAPAYLHAVELAFTLDDVPAAQRYARAYLALDPTDDEANGIQLAAALAELAQARSPRVGALVDTAKARALGNAWASLRRWSDPGETAIRIARQLATGQRADIVLADTLGARLRLVVELGYRGHVKEAYAVLGNREARIFVELALLGGVPHDSARAVFGRWLAAGSPSARFALPWWADQRDTASIAAFRRRAEGAARGVAGARMTQRDALYGAAAASAYLALASGDTTKALAHFAALPDSTCLGCYLDRLREAQVLNARGRHRDAAALLGERLFVLLTPTEVTMALERARAAEKLGERETAGDAYALVAGAWSNPDPELQAKSAEARAGLQRLGRAPVPKVAAASGSSSP